MLHDAVALIVPVIRRHGQDRRACFARDRGGEEGEPWRPDAMWSGSSRPAPGSATRAPGLHCFILPQSAL
jgi:hypothetical protein